MRSLFSFERLVKGGVFLVGPLVLESALRPQAPGNYTWRRRGGADGEETSGTQAEEGAMRRVERRSKSRPRIEPTYRTQSKACPTPLYYIFRNEKDVCSCGLHALHDRSRIRNLGPGVWGDL